jgi:hypothetical protein
MQDDDDDQYAYAEGDPELMQLIQERDQAFLNTDYAWARDRIHQVDPTRSETFIQRSFHMARMQWTKCPPELKEASERFLATNGRMDA